MVQKDWEVGVSSRDRGEIPRGDPGGWLFRNLPFQLSPHPCCTHLPHLSGVPSVYTWAHEDFIRPYNCKQNC